MEDIKFIRDIMAHGANKSGKPIGNCMVYKLNNGNVAKAYVDGGGIYRESHGVKVEIINKTDGKVDTMYFPFRNYFAPTQCSANSPRWYQHIVDGRWYFSQMYTHVLLTARDYKAIADAVCEYIELFG